MSIVTTGQDVVEETVAFNEKLAERLADVPPIYEATDLAAARGGFGVFPPPTLLPEGVDRAVPGRHGDVVVRVFTPPTVSGVYLHLHPGGRVLGSARNQDGRLWDLAVATSLAVVSVDYRLAPENPHPAAVHDCVDAARWLTATTEFGTDRLLIGGESAGAELAVQVLLALRDSGQHKAFRAAYLAYGVYDAALTPSARAFGEQHLVTGTLSERWFRAQSFPGMSEEQLHAPDISPLYADLRDLPAARFVVGTRDPLLDDTLFMSARWRAAGNPAEVEIVAEAPHGFTAFPLTVAQREVAAQHAFLAAH
ncbi:alpha/beta hydrolase fold domain-containing protein [Kutzneria buriramensis]|uniref:Acetyl esterase/lipase n=1 Tax=Kutzneria buriramensis TaxID=1045776 RepID=A0A3E0H4K4_9PSEU|nr:alpha/beta hydrolase fold domain-containing protein [Kutzneria buriramensis]REH38168.1 acetyl esterase/lipase [Kutzneria buriramensis]